MPRLVILSGGQTGADQAALRAAHARGIVTGGWCPLGWRTEVGPCPELGTLYGLRELPNASYPFRTRRIVQDCHAMLWFGNPCSPGGKLTQRLCIEETKDTCTVTLLGNMTPAEVLDWLVGMVFPGNEEVRLLVAGNRESSSPGIGVKVEVFLGDVLDLLAMEVLKNG